MKTKPPEVGAVFSWDKATYRIVAVHFEDRHGEGPEWYVEATRWIKSRGEYSGRAGFYRWGGTE